MINFHGSTATGRSSFDAINGDWGGAPFEDLMKGLDYAEKTYPFIDKDRSARWAPATADTLANWILGHTNRFKMHCFARRHVQRRIRLGSTERTLVQQLGVQRHSLRHRASYQKWSPHQ